MIRKVFSIRINEEEAELFAQMAKMYNIPVGSCIRECALRFIQSYLLETEERPLSHSPVDTQEIRQQLDDILYALLYHLPEVPAHLKEKARRSAEERIERLKGKVPSKQ